MALNRAEIQAIAKELLTLHNDSYEYSLVYEHDDAEDWSDDEKRAILDAMYEATITISFDGKEQ
jgi:hypothetical protein